MNSKKAMDTSTAKTGFELFNIENEKNIPPSMKGLNNWVVWKVESNGNGRPTKVPYQSKHPGKKAKSTDQTTWSSYQEAIEAFKTHRDDSIMGIGFVVSGTPFTGVDLDHCRNRETGEIEPWAKEIIDILKSYHEITPSGTGVRVYVKGKLPDGHSCRGDGIEVYSKNRFFTVSGNSPPGFKEIMPREEELKGVYDKFIKNGNPEDAPVSDENFSHLCGKSPFSDNEVFDHALQANNKEKFLQLWNNEIGPSPSKAYPSQSEADLALCSILAFWTQRDPEAIDRLFRQSKLFRNKWDETHGNMTYGEKTIRKAIERTIDVYTPTRQESEPAKDPLNTRTLITKSEINKRGEGKSLSEILNQPELEERYLVKPLLSRGDKGFVVSSYKIGKTLFLTQLTLCLSMGIPFLGFEIPKPAKVLYVRFELKESRFKKRLESMVAGLGGMGRLQMEPIFELVKGFNISTENDFQWLMGLLGKHQAEVLMLDPLYKLSPIDLKDTANAMPLIRRFDTIIEAYPDLLLITAHHLRKSGADERDNWDQTYGPMFFFADADFQVRLKAKHRETHEFTLDVISNDAPIDSFMFKRDDNTLLYYVPDIDKDYEEAVLNHIDKEKQAKTAVIDWMRKDIGLSRRQAQEMLNRLISRGKIQEVRGKGRQKILELTGEGVV